MKKQGERLHIMHLARWYPHRYDPMFGLFVQRHAEAAALFETVSVVYAEPNQSDGNRTEIEQENVEGVQNIRIYYPVSKRNTKIARLMNLFSYYRAIFKGMRLAQKHNGKADVIHFHILSRLGIPALYYKIFRGTPYLITEHWSRYLPYRNEFNGRLRKWISRIIVRNSFMLTSVTENLKQAMLGHKLESPRMTILPNVVDMHKFGIQDRKDDGKLRLAHISCFEDRSKNISGILNVLADLKTDLPQLESVMIGDGLDFELLKRRAAALGLAEPELRFTGVLQGKQLVDELAQADFLVIFSNYENLPVVIPEAFACGLPVIATKVGGIPEIITNENGILIERADENALKEAIFSIFENPKRFEKHKIRAMVESTYGKEAVGKLLHQWYRESVS